MHVGNAFTRLTTKAKAEWKSLLGQPLLVFQRLLTQIEIPGAGILCLCFHLARVHFHPRILQAVTTHLVIAERTDQDGCSEGREDVEGKA